MTKYVVASRPLKAQWANTVVLGRDTGPIEEIRALKSVPGKDIVQYGFGQLSYALLEAGLLDELRLWVHPLFVGTATTSDLLFRPTSSTALTLLDTVALNTGIVVLTYRANG
jgi:dihydrofolate reductase